MGKFVDIEKIKFSGLTFHDEEGEAYIPLRAVEMAIAKAAAEPQKKSIAIELEGCIDCAPFNDCTVFNMDITEDEYNFLQKVAELSRETSTCECMPRMWVDKW